MLKKTLAGSLLLACSWSAIAAPVPLQFDVEAHIPTSSFYVVASGGWDSTVQRMSWDPVANKLNTLSRQIDAKNTGGNVEAYLETSPALTQVGGAGQVPLAVTVGGTALGVGVANKEEVLSAAEAAAGRKLSLEVTQGASGTAPIPGDYVGVVNLMFDFTPPAP